MIGVLLTLAHAAHADVPTTPAEEASLRAHEVVVRDLPARSDGAVRVQSLLDIPAPQAAVWTALVDFQGRLGGNSALKAVEPYRAASGAEQWIRWTVSAMGFEVVYHNHYVLDRANGTVTYELDKSQENDLAASHGTLAIFPSPADPAQIRLFYEAESDFGHAVPTFAQRWMTASATKDFMADISRRAQAVR
jgi:hypothetical protein